MTIIRRILKEILTTIVSLFQLLFVIAKSGLQYVLIAVAIIELLHPSVNPGFSSYKRYSKTETYTYGDEYSLMSNYNLIQYVAYESAFDSLSLEDKKRVAEAIVYCEARYINLPKVNISYFAGDEDDEIAHYNHSTRTISFNYYFLMSDDFTALQLLDTCLHECRHYYQHVMVDAYNRLTAEEQQLHFYDDVRLWRDNMSNYVDSDDDEVGYYFQIVERDARNYAERESLVYIEDILQIRANVEDEMTDL